MRSGRVSPLQVSKFTHVRGQYQYFSIENIFLLFFLLCFTMPYVRVGLEGFVWPKEYQADPTGLPRIIELAVLLLLFFLILKGKFTISKFLTMLHNDKIFLILIVISFYVLIQPFFLDLFSFVISPTAKGAIRGSLLIPLIAYTVGRYYPLTEKGIKIFVIGLLIAGSLQAIAILYPPIFPHYMIYGHYFEGKPLLIFQESIDSGIRRTGFWDLSTQAATFMATMICLSIAVLSHFKSKKIKFLMSGILSLYIIALLGTLQRIQVAAISFLILYLILERVGTLKTTRGKQYLLKFSVLGLFILLNILYPYIFITRLSSGYHSFYQTDRVEVIWPSYLDFISREPSVLLFGSGFASDALDDAGTPMQLAHAHNQFLGWISGIGLFMTILFIYMFFTYYKRAMISSSSIVLNDNEKMISYFSRLVLITIFIICLAESPLQQEPISILVFFVGGIVSSLYELNISKHIHK